MVWRSRIFLRLVTMVTDIHSYLSSNIGQQVDLRLQQLFFWPRQYMMLRKQNWANTAMTRAYYISFYNSMWLVANDIIIGLAIGSFLMANNQAMSIKFHKILHVGLTIYSYQYETK